MWKVSLRYQNYLYYPVCTTICPYFEGKEGFGFWLFCDSVKCSNATDMMRSDTKEGLVQCKLIKHDWVCGSEMNRLGCSSVQSCKIIRQLKKEQKGKEKSDQWKNWLGKSCVLKLRNRVSHGSVLRVLIWQFGLCYCLMMIFIEIGSESQISRYWENATWGHRAWECFTFFLYILQTAYSQPGPWVSQLRQFSGPCVGLGSGDDSGLYFTFFEHY